MRDKTGREKRRERERGDTGEGGSDKPGSHVSEQGARQRDRQGDSDPPRELEGCLAASSHSHPWTNGCGAAL